ncbi:hypothetical protein BC830DRAFT_558619 [Chytriomyces sp. MP71]|nr:hypothetical protein BC830DRAFT_558619 [Chytriomyces sp. MP71]
MVDARGNVESPSKPQCTPIAQYFGRTDRSLLCFQSYILLVSASQSHLGHFAKWWETPCPHHSRTVHQIAASTCTLHNLRALRASDGVIRMQRWQDRGWCGCPSARWRMSEVDSREILLHERHSPSNIIQRISFSPSPPLQFHIICCIAFNIHGGGHPRSPFSVVMHTLRLVIYSSGMILSR